MKYEIKFKPRAVKDLKSLNKTDKMKIISKIEMLSENLHGNVKRLTNFTPEYRLRIGNYRVLFEIEENIIIIYRIKHRKEAYK